MDGPHDVEELSPCCCPELTGFSSRTTWLQGRMVCHHPQRGPTWGDTLWTPSTPQWQVPRWVSQSGLAGNRTLGGKRTLETRRMEGTPNKSVPYCQIGDPHQWNCYPNSTASAATWPSTWQLAVQPGEWVGSPLWTGRNAIPGTVPTFGTKPICVWCFPRRLRKPSVSMEHKCLGDMACHWRA